MTNHKAYDVVCIGNYTKDTIVSPAGTSYVDGGAVNYSAHAANRLGVKVVVVTHLADEDARVVEKFRQTGIDCLPVYTPQSTCMRLEYPTKDPDVRSLSVTGLADAIVACEVENLDAKSAVIGSSLRGEVGLDVIQALHEGDILVAMDVQGFVRVLRDGALLNEPWDEMAQTLALVDVVKADAVEAESLTGEADIYKAALAFAAMGPNEVLITHKEGLLVYLGGEYINRPFYPGNLSGRSGRGDTCLGAYVSMRLSKSAAEASIWAAAVTSLKMERQGPFDRPLGDVQALIQSKYNGSGRGEVHPN